MDESEQTASAVLADLDSCSLSLTPPPRRSRAFRQDLNPRAIKEGSSRSRRWYHKTRSQPVDSAAEDSSRCAQARQRMGISVQGVGSRWGGDSVYIAPCASAGQMYAHGEGESDRQTRTRPTVTRPVAGSTFHPLSPALSTGPPLTTTTAMAAMYQLPLETLQRIFELACTDGGRTGCALSQVSRAVRAAARKSRFHSVALVARPTTLAAFVELYDKENTPGRGGDQARVSHLFVTFPDSARLLSRPESSHAYLGAVRTLFHLLADDLRSLVVHGLDGAAQTVLPVFPCPLPALCDVTLFGLGSLCANPRADTSAGDSGGERDSPSPPTLTSDPFFPAASRVHIILPSPHDTHCLSLGALQHHFPRATHLRISNLHPSARTLGFLSGLVDALASGSRSSSAVGACGGSGASHGTWGSMRSVVLQPSAPPRRGVSEEGEYGRYGDPERTERYTELWHEMRRVENAARVQAVDDGWEQESARDGAGVRVRLLEGCARTEQEWFAAARRAWVRLAESGRGWEDGDRGEAIGENEDGRASRTSCTADAGVRQTSSGWSHMTVLYPI